MCYAVFALRGLNALCKLVLVHIYYMGIAGAVVQPNGVFTHKRKYLNGYEPDKGAHHYGFRRRFLPKGVYYPGAGGKLA